jgi:hypothetical protein
MCCKYVTPFMMHQYIADTNHLAPLYWYCKNSAKSNNWFCKLRVISLPIGATGEVPPKYCTILRSEHSSHSNCSNHSIPSHPPYSPSFKVTVSGDFCLQVSFHESSSSGSLKYHSGHYNFFETSWGYSQVKVQTTVSTTLVAIATGISDTGGKFATSYSGVVYTGGKLLPVSTTHAVKWEQYQTAYT